MKKIDVHVHTRMWGENRPSFNTPLATPQQVIERYEELNIEKGFIMPLLSPESRNFVQSNEEVIHIADKYKDSFYFFCNIDPRMVNNTSGSDLSKLIEYYKENAPRGEYVLVVEGCTQKENNEFWVNMTIEEHIDYYVEKINAVTIGDVVEASKNIALDSVYFLKGKE